jgi:hypothetical protein
MNEMPNLDGSFGCEQRQARATCPRNSRQDAGATEFRYSIAKRIIERVGLGSQGETSRRVQIR